MSLRRALPWAVFVGIPSVLILPMLFRGELLFGSDVASVFHAQRIVIADAFRSGRLPTWDPHVMAGFPLLAAVQGAIFYPPSWFCVLLSAGAFWTLSVWAHLILSGVFAREWLERGMKLGPAAAVAGALLAMLSTYAFQHVFLGHVNYVWAYPWLFAALWRVERFLVGPSLRRGLLLSLVVALLVLAGVPQFVLFLGLIVAARLGQLLRGDRRRFRDAAKLLGWMGLGIVFCAPQLLPTLELWTQMQRGSVDDPAFLLQYPLPAGDAWRGLVSGQTTGEAYVPAGPLVFVLAGVALALNRRAGLFWLGIGCFGVLMALGPQTPFHPVASAILPGAGLFRVPSRYLLLFTLAGIALSALGIQSLWDLRSRKFRGLAAALALLAALHLLWMGRDFLRPIDGKRLAWPAELAERLRDRCGREGRAASAGKADVAEAGKCQAIGVDHVGGYDPMMLRRFAELINALRGAPLGANMPVLAAVAPHPAMDMLGAKVWHFATGEPAPGFVWRRWGESNFYENPRALPRAWIVSNAVVLEDQEERLKTIAQGTWDPRKTVILESFPDEKPPQPVEEPGKARVLTKSPGRYEIEAQNEVDAYLVLSEAWYPGWSVEVDGLEARILPANHLIQAVRLSPGSHRVRFTYRSRYLPAGFAVALLAGLIPLGLAISSRRRVRASAATSGAPSTAGS